MKHFNQGFLKFSLVFASLILASPGWAVPEGMVVREGMLVKASAARKDLSETVPAAPVTHAVPPGATVIDFDESPAPDVFKEKTRLTTKYASLGVTFEGPGGK